MGSSSSQATNTDTNNLALDRRATLGEGMQLLESVIVDPSDTVMVAAMRDLKAGFEVLTSNSTIQLADLLGFADQLSTLAENQSVRMDAASAMQLSSSIQFLEAAQESGKAVISLASETIGTAFDFAEDVASDNSDLSIRALDLVKDIKTSDYTATLKTLAVFMSVFGLAAMMINKK